MSDAPSPLVELSPASIQNRSSSYLTEGVKQDCWEITACHVSPERLEAKLHMTSTFVSPTDEGGFHLTIFTSTEMLSQLLTIYMHWRAGHATKSREVWMRDFQIACKAPIRDPEHITVDMVLETTRWRETGWLAHAESRIQGGTGGLFTTVSSCVMP